MTTNQKILLGIGGLALAYFLFKDKLKGKSSEVPSTPSAPQNTGDSPCPQGQVLQTMNCLVAPCPPPKCVDRPKPNPNLETKVYTCMDGFKVSETRDKTKSYTMQYIDPCLKHGGILREKDKYGMPRVIK